MPGTKAGTGQPLTLKCARCKRSRDRYGSGKRGELVRTGAERPYYGVRRGGRTGTRAFECRCKVCGHVGWYAHADVQRLPLQED